MILVTPISSTVRGSSKHPATSGFYLVRGRARFSAQECHGEDYDNMPRGLTLSILLFIIHDRSKLCYWKAYEETVYEVFDPRLELPVLFT